MKKIRFTKFESRTDKPTFEMPEDSAELNVDPECLSPVDMLTLTSEIMQMPEFTVLYNGERVQVAVEMMKPAHPGATADSDGFPVKGFVGSIHKSGQTPKIWTPFVQDRPWREAKQPEKNPTTGKAPTIKDFSTGLLQRVFNLLEGEAIRERSLTSREGKQLTTITIWKLLDPQADPQSEDYGKLVAKVRTAYETLFTDDVDPAELDALTTRFMGAVGALRQLQSGDM